MEGQYKENPKDNTNVILPRIETIRNSKVGNLSKVSQIKIIIIKYIQ